MKRKYEGFIVSVENWNIPIDLEATSEDLKISNKFGIAYYKEDVIGSGFDDFVFYGVRKTTIQRFIKFLKEQGVPENQIHLNAIQRIG